MGKLTRYPKYKDTGVRWLGEIPKHWDLTRISSVTALRKEQVSAESLNGLSVRHYSIPNVQETGDAALEDGSEIDSNKFRILGNEILVSKLNPRKQTVALTQVSNDPAVCSTEFVCLKPLTHVDQRFIFYTFLSENVRQYLDSSVESVTRSHQRVNPEVIYKMLFASPPIEEQKMLSAFLDHETAKIDRLIARQERLIELLKEKRQAVISYAVTKGLNPDAPMKDSGVEWLGEVPAHWVTCRAKHLLNFVTSGSRGWAQFYSDQGDLFVRITNLTRDGISVDLSDPQYVLPPKGSEGERSKVKQNDLLISITADLGSVGVATAVVEGAYVSQHVALARPNLRVTSSRWFGYALISNNSKKQLEASGYGGTKIQLSLEDIRGIAVSCPPHEEQMLIANYIDEKLSQFDLLIGKVMSGIKLMNEHRSALISATVTGKIDVRGWQAPDTEPQDTATAVSA